MKESINIQVKSQLIQKIVEAIILLLGLGMLIYWLYFIFALNSANPPFSPDSWSYMEIGKNIFKNFGEINTIRQYEYRSYLNVSFPPLYPLLISALNLLVNWGIYAGYILNFVINILILLVFIVLSRKFFKTGIFGLFAFSNLIFNKYYLIESLAARSIPLYILLFLLIIFILTSEIKKPSLKTAAVGVLAGLMILTRFDFLLPAIILGLLISFKKRGSIIPFFCSLLLVISPWLIYSFIHFRKIFISDNTRTVLMAVNNHVSDYYPADSLQPTIFNNFGGWSNFLGKKMATCFETFGRYLGNNLPLIFLLIFTLFALTLVLVKNGSFGITADRKKILHQLSLLAPPLLLLLLSIAATGYADERYFTVISVYLFLILLYLNLSLIKFDDWPYLYKNLIYLLIVFLVYTNFQAQMLTNHADETAGQSITFSRGNLEPVEYEKISQAVRGENNPVLLIDNDSYSPFKFGALTGLKTVATPGNSKFIDLAMFAQVYGVTHVVTDHPGYLDKLRNGYAFTRFDDSSVYKLERK